MKVLFLLIVAVVVSLGVYIFWRNMDKKHEQELKDFEERMAKEQSENLKALIAHHKANRFKVKLNKDEFYH